MASTQPDYETLNRELDQKIDATVAYVSDGIEQLKARVAFLESELLFIAGRAGLAASYDDDFHAIGVLLEIRDIAKAACSQPKTIEAA